MHCVELISMVKCPAWKNFQKSLVIYILDQDVLKMVKRGETRYSLEKRTRL